MRHLLRNLIYRAEAVEFHSPFPVNEAIQRLEAETDISLLGPMTRQSISGKVTKDKVKLQRVIPFVQNSFKPTFIGHFEPHERGSVLRGQFGLSWGTRAFMTFWFGFCTFWTVLAVVGALAKPEVWFTPLAGVGLVIVGLGMVWLGRWFGRNDQAYICNAVALAIRSRAA